MIRGTLLEKLTNAVLSGVVALVVTTLGAYIAISKAQTNHETRLSAIEDAQKTQPDAIEKVEQRLNRRLDEIQQDVREIRKDQTELLRELGKNR